MTRYGVHSPFVYALIRDVIRDDRHFYGFDEIEALRARMLRDDRAIERTDFGAGTRTHQTVARIARSAAAPPKLGRLLFRLVEARAPATILELGTSLGIGTRCLSGPDRHERLITIEGDPAVRAIALEHLEGRRGVESLEGRFDEVLPEALAGIDRLDLVYLDGHHEREATIRYFEACLAKAHDRTAFVVDDIHWSPGMESAWKTMRKHPATRLSIDLYRCGLVFLRPAQREVEHFRLRF